MQHFALEPSAVCHVKVASGQAGTKAVQDIQWRNGTGGRDVGCIGQLVVGHELTDRLQVGAGDDQEPLGC